MYVLIGNMISGSQRRHSRTGSDRGSRLAPIAALLLLSLLWACATLRGDLLPNLLSIRLPYFERQILPLAALAFASGLTALTHKVNRLSGQLRWISIAIGMGLFAVPAWLLYLASGGIAGPARAALLTLVPVFAAVLEPYISPNSQPQIRGALLGSLLALGGAWFVFPVAVPYSIQTTIAFVAVILAAASIAAANCYGTASAALLRGDRTGQLAAMAAIGAASAAAALALTSALVERPLWRWHEIAPELLWSAAVELPALVLLYWLMPRISAQRMATRYILAPLLAILIGAVALQSAQEVRLRTWLGMLCMAIGALWILFAPQETPDSSTLSLE